MEDTAKAVVLKCINALELVSEECPSLGHLTDGRILARLLSSLKNETVETQDFVSLIPKLESLLQEHFAGPKLVDFDEAASGGVVELTKLCLLLLHITVITEDRLRSRLVNSPILSFSVQARVKYLLEAIQKQGAGLSSKFLNILCMEKLDSSTVLECDTPVSSSSRVVGSPRIYTNSPRSSASPLRELIQSPPFRLQKLLSAKKHEVRQLQQQVHSLEEEKMEMKHQLALADKKIDKLNLEVHRLETRLQDSQKVRDYLELQIKSGEELTHQQMSQLGREAKQLRTENASLESTVQKVLSTNDELESKNESLSTRLTLTAAERDRLKEEISNLFEAKLMNEDVIESQASDLKDMKTELEELQQCLQEYRPQPRVSEASFSVCSPMNTTAPISPPNSSVCEESLAESVVDKMLQETRAQLAQVEGKYKALQDNFTSLQEDRDQLLAQVESLTRDNSNLTGEMQGVHEAYTTLQEDHEHTSDLLKQCEEQKQQAKSIAKDLQAKVERLKTEVKDFHTRLSEAQGEVESWQEKEAAATTSLAEETRCRATVEENLSSTIAKAEQDMQQLTQQHQAQLDEINRNLATAMSECESLKQDVSTLQGEKQSLEVRLEEEKQSSLNMSQDYKSKLTELEEVKGKLEEETRVKQERNEKLQCENERLSTQLEAEVQAATNLRQDVECKTKELEGTKDRMEGLLLVERENVERLELEKQKLVTQLDTETQTSISLKEKVEGRTKELEETKNKLEQDIQVECEKYRTLQLEMSTQIDQLTTERASLTEELDAAKVSYNSLKLEMEKNQATRLEERTKLESEVRIKEESLTKLLSEKEKEIDGLRKELPLLNETVKEKESRYESLQAEMKNQEKEMLELKKEHQLVLDAQNHDKLQMVEISKEKENAITELESTVGRLTNEVKVMREDHSKLNMELEEAKGAHEEERRRFVQEMEGKVNQLSTSNQDLQDKISRLATEKANLLGRIRVKEEAFVSAAAKAKELSESFTAEKAAITKMLRDTQLVLHCIPEKFVKLNRVFAHAEKLLNEELESTKSSLKSQQNANCELRKELEMLKLDLTTSDTQHRELLSEARQQLASTTTEKDAALKTVEKQKTTIQQYEQRMGELEEKCLLIDSLEKKIEQNIEKENQINEELSSARTALEAIEKEREELAQKYKRQAEEHEKALQEIAESQKQVSEELRIAQMALENIRREKEEFSKMYKSQEEEHKTQIGQLQSELTEREGVIKSKMALFKEQMECVVAGREASEKQVSVLTAMVEQAEEKHKAALASLKEEAERHQKTYTDNITSLQEKVSSLEQTNCTVTKELQEKLSMVTSLTEQLAKSKEAHAEMEREKKEIIEKLEQEKQSMGDVVQKQEDALTSLQQQVQEVVEQHNKEETLNSKVFEMESKYPTLQRDLEEGRAEVTRLTGEVQVKGEMIVQLKSEVEGLTALLADEKLVTKNEFDMKEKACAALQMEMETLKKEVKGKEEEKMSVQEELKQLKEVHLSEFRHIEGELQKALASLQAEQRALADKEAVIEALRDKARKETEQNEKTTEAKLQMSQDMARLNEKLAERDQFYQSLQQKSREEVEQCRREIVNLMNDTEEKNRRISTLQQSIVELKRNFTDQLKDIEMKIRQSFACELWEEENLNITNEEVAGESSKEIITRIQKHLGRRSQSGKRELERVCTQEEVLVEATDMEGKRMSELERQLKEREKEVSRVASQYKTQLTEANDSLKKRDQEMEALRAELKSAVASVKQQATNIQSLEAKLIDKEQQTTAAKEEVMRVEREAEKSTRSLKEELEAVKEKYRAERSNIADRMKMSYKNEVEKLMVQLEEQAQAQKDKEVVAQKYELAKKKLTETISSLNDMETTKKQYEKQVTKYKEHVSKLEASVQKECTKQVEATNRLAEIEGRYQPLKEKLKESENTIKRLGGEKRSLEVQLIHAEAKLKEMKKQHERESLGGADVSASTSRGPRSRLVSNVKGVDIIVSRASVSSNESFDTDDSQRPLIPKTRQTRAIRGKGMRRAASVETVARKAPTERGPTKQMSESSIQISRPLGSKTVSANTKMLPPPSLLPAPEPKEPSPTPETSLGHSVPRDMLFKCEDEDELFSNKYLLDMKVGRCSTLGVEQWKRLSELQRRNSLYPPHMRSAYPAELQFNLLEDFEDDKLREGCAVEDRQLIDLTQAAESLALDSPAFNLRKRKSPSVSSSGSGLSLESSGGSKRPKRLSTSYSRPGPPTPGRRSLGPAEKENRRESILSDITLASWANRSRKGRSPSLTSAGSSPGSCRGQPSLSRSVAGQSPAGRSSRAPSVVSKASGVGGTPRNKKPLKTPASLRKLLARGKSPWRKLGNSEQEGTRKHTRPDRLINRINKNLKPVKK